MTGKKLKHLLATVLLVLPMTVSAIMSTAQVVTAAEAETTTNVTVTKVLFDTTAANKLDPTAKDNDSVFDNQGKSVTDLQGGKVLPGVTFKVYNITDQYTAGDDATIQTAVKDTGDYSKYGDAFAEGVTDDKGQVNFKLDNLKDGKYQTYMIVETKYTDAETEATTDAEGEKTAVDEGQTIVNRATPLIVTMPLDTDKTGDAVYLYPKNYEDDMTTKDLSETSKKDYFDAKTGQASAGLGDTVSYTIKEVIPFDIAERTKFNVFDQPSAGLEDQLNTVKVTDENGTDVTDKLFTKAGYPTDETSATPNGFSLTGNMKALIGEVVNDKSTGYAGKTLTITYNAVVTKADVQRLDNTVTTDYGNKPHTETGKTPIYVGGKRFVKVKTGDAATKLQDAVFVLTDKDGNIIVQDGDMYVASEVKAAALDLQKINADAGGETVTDKKKTVLEGLVSVMYPKSESQASSSSESSVSASSSKVDIPQNPTPVLSVSDGDGAFEFTGLQYGTYHAVEVAAPKGYALATDAKEFQVSATSYYKDADKMTDGKADPLLIENAPKGVLPHTGGMGIYLIIAAGMAVMIAGFLFLKKGSHHEEV